MPRPPRHALRSVAATARRSPRRLAVIAAVVAVVAATVGIALTTSVRRVQAASPAPGVSLFDTKAFPRVVTDQDRRAVEVGVRVRFASAGAVTALKFYRGPQNTGSRVGHLWSIGGQLLASATFTDGGRSGWQTATVAQPVGVRAGAEYVVSYFAPKGAYSADANYFAGRAVSRGPLTAPAGRNGVYRYGSTSGFPTDSWHSSNYYVDLIFQAGNPAPPPVLRPTATPSATAVPTPATTVGTILPPRPAPTTSTASPSTPQPSSSSAPPVRPGSFPGAADTGVPPGRALKEVQGDYHVTKDGAVVQDLLIHGALFIEADNVTVRYVEARCASSYWIVRDQGRNTTITDSTFSVDRSKPGAYCQYGITSGDNVTLRRNEVAYTPNGLTFAGGTATVEDNWVHDQAAYPGQGDHVDAVLLSGGGSGPYVFRHNTFSVPMNQTAALAFYDDFGQLRNVVADGNLLEGGGYTVYGGGNGSANVRITNNVFSRSVFPKGGFYGPVTGFDKGGSGNVWSGNVWSDTGAPVTP